MGNKQTKMKEKKTKKHCPVCGSTKMVENEFGSLRCVKCGYMFIKGGGR